MPNASKPAQFSKAVPNDDEPCEWHHRHYYPDKPLVLRIFRLYPTKEQTGERQGSPDYAEPQCVHRLTCLSQIRSTNDTNEICPFRDALHAGMRCRLKGISSGAISKANSHPADRRPHFNEGARLAPDRHMGSACGAEGRLLPIGPTVNQFQAREFGRQIKLGRPNTPHGD